MASHTILEVPNTLLFVLSANIGGCVLMAAEAGVLAMVFSGVASRAGRVVVLVEHEELVVIERSRFPGLSLVALRAANTDAKVAVHGVARRSMAACRPWVASKRNTDSSRYLRRRGARLGNRATPATRPQMRAATLACRVAAPGQAVHAGAIGSRQHLRRLEVATQQR